MKMKLTVLENDAPVEKEVSIITADYVRADIIRSRQGWPRPEDAMNLQLCLLAYCALVRTGAVANTVKVDAFMDTIQDAELDQSEDATEQGADKS
jgi:hypothetical protein